MSQHTTIKHIENIVSHVKIINVTDYSIGDNKYLINQRLPYSSWNLPMDQFGQNKGNIDQNRNNLVQHLAMSLYTNFYVEGTTDQTPKPSSEAIPPIEERMTYMDLLSSKNHTIDGWDMNWRVYHISGNGQIFVEKNKQVKMLRPGSFQLANNPGGQVQMNSYVHIQITKENRTAQPVFYHVNAQVTPEPNAELVRYYFHTDHHGAPEIVHQITSRFNKYKIPFHFKCLNHADLFKRTDSAVLYIAKRHTVIVSKLIEQMWPHIKDRLLNKTPLFTKVLAPGLGFAEDPGQNQSFGLHRCQTIAEGLVTAHFNGTKNHHDTVKSVTDCIAEKGLRMEAFYLSPNTKFPYRHPELN